MKRSLKMACRRAGNTAFRFHDLRHTYPGYLVMNNMTLKAMKRLLVQFHRSTCA